MKRRNHLARIAVCLLAVPAVLVGASSSPASAFEEQLSFSSGELEINNLIGAIDIQEHSGSSFEVRVNVQGRDGSRERIEIESSTGGSAELTIVFPIDDERRYVYPELGPGSKTTFTPDSGEGNWLRSVLRGLRSRRITVTGSGSGLEVWADIEVRVPRGGRLRVYNGVGNMTAKGVDGDLRLDTHSGTVTASDLQGDLVADTGSGSVSVRNVTGAVLADTGSGDVEISGCRGKDVNVDTGSGSVKLEEIDVTKLLVDTGSGRVHATSVRTDSANIDTGSGSVTLELDRMGDGDFVIDTGSGGVTLKLPAYASADVEASTGSGGIEVDLDQEHTIRHREDDEMRLRIGDGAARVQLDTGSGGIHIEETR